MRRRWLSGRAILAHVAVLVVVSGCLLAGWWQLERARSGNGVSWGYAFQWPIFAVVAVVMWWQFVHHRRVDQPLPPEPEPVVSRARRRDAEDPALREYNDRLEFLSAFGRRKTWRNPSGQP